VIHRETEGAPASVSSVSGGPAASSLAQQFTYARILCFGDSLTYGTTLRAPGTIHPALVPVEGYVPKLGRLIEVNYEDAQFELINSGVGAEGTSEGRLRLAAEIRRSRPELVLLLQGTVDAGSVPPSFGATRRNLRAMMNDVLSQGIDLIVGTVPPFHPDGFRATGIDNVPVLNEIIREEAARLGVSVADHERAFGDDPGLQGPDGVHPNDNGYEVMAATWFETLQELVERSGT
jgi:lysophospholipase L1-like esterase